MVDPVESLSMVEKIYIFFVGVLLTIQHCNARDAQLTSFIIFSASTFAIP